METGKFINGDGVSEIASLVKNSMNAYESNLLNGNGVVPVSKGGTGSSTALSKGDINDIWNEIDGVSQELTDSLGVLQVDRGGTGAADPATARANLGLEDTGWVTIAGNYVKDSNYYVAYRAIGNIVQVIGCSHGSVTLGGSGNTTAATLPKKYWPPVTVNFVPNLGGGALDAGSSTRGIVGRITADGEVVLYRDTATMNYWGFSVMYFI